jgi:hypothetical protein
MLYHGLAQEVVDVRPDFFRHLLQGFGPVGILRGQRQRSSAERHRPAFLSQCLSCHESPERGQDFDHGGLKTGQLGLENLGQNFADFFHRWAPTIRTFEVN